MSRSFNVEQFIAEIEPRRAIWDFSHDDYNNRLLKQEQWDDIVDLFGGTGLSGEERELLTQKLKQKWTNIRSCHSREIRRVKNIQNGSTAPYRRSYIYCDRLSFLTNSSLNTKYSSEEDPAPNPLRPNPREDGPADKKIKIYTDDTKNSINTSNKYVQVCEKRQYTVEDDEDRMFLLSLLTSFRKIPDSKKSAAKIQLISTIESFGASTSQNTPQNTWFINYLKTQFEECQSQDTPTTSTTDQSRTEQSRTIEDAQSDTEDIFIVKTEIKEETQDDPVGIDWTI